MRGARGVGGKGEERRDVQSTFEELDEDTTRCLQTLDTSEETLIYRAQQVQKLRMWHLPHFLYPSRDQARSIALKPI